ncbi:MAG TPA: septum site-determining protein MinC [Steroidobacteraceae bacterium]|jgi:septum site-determining protein MinC|nr:septum site-determining protein MinC [Steroidobacteraceae bacterium]
MNRPAEATNQEAALEIRFGPVDMAQVRIRSTDPGIIVDELTGRVATAPKFFQRTAVCLDLSELGREPDAAELRGVVEAVRRAGMLPVGLVNGTAATDTLAREVDMPVLAQFRATSKSPPVVHAAEPEPDVSPLIHTQAVRSGQRLYARRRDLIVMAPVGAGAELMADGCAHVYAALRGRVMAGARGDTRARVFCQAFYAELVSIAGVFRVFETIPAELAGKPVQAWLDGDALRFARLDE